jgi:DNA-directed RNA polymerase subunit RPC12/RpoP
MIHFSCPTCLKKLRAPEEMTGSKVRCPKCQQKLLVPPPVRSAAHNKTVLGKIELGTPTAPNSVGEIEKAAQKPSPFAAASTPPVLGPADMLNPKAMQDDNPPVAMIVQDAVTPGTNGRQQSSGNELEKARLNVYLLAKTWGGYLGDSRANHWRAGFVARGGLFGNSSASHWLFGVEGAESSSGRQSFVLGFYGNNSANHWLVVLSDTPSQG